MLYLITQFTVIFLIATLLGGAIGWLMRGRTLAKDLEAKWKSAYSREREAAEQGENERDTFREKVHLLEAQIEELRGQLKQGRTETKTEPEIDPAVVREKVAEIAQRTSGDGGPPDDDLKTIKGIGPKLEALLKEMGIISYRQIANFQEEDIQFIAAALGSFPDRITRDDWMAGAHHEQEKKYGAAP